jgi:tetratricopeptide (TPR) repeat protein
MGNYSLALSYYQMALQIQKKSFSNDDPSLAITYNNIGAVYNSMRNYPAVLSYYKETLKIEQKSLPSNHPSLAATYQ